MRSEAVTKIVDRCRHFVTAASEECRASPGCVAKTQGSVRTNLVTISWLFVIFGEHQAMAQLIAKRVLISPVINKDLPVRHPLLARGNFASVNLNHQK